MQGIDFLRNYPRINNSVSVPQWRPEAKPSEKIVYLANEQKQDDKKEKVSIPFKWLGRLLGFWLVSLTIATLLLTFWPAISFEVNYLLNRAKKTHFILDPEDLKRLSSKFSDVIAESQVKILSPVNRDFGLVIPKIGVNSKVFANTNLNDEGEYREALTVGVAHALGSSFPGQRGTIFIFGHSTDLDWEMEQANSLFYPLNKLEAGDEIDVFYNDWRFVYQVVEKKIVAPEDVSFLQRAGREKLVLQTCWPPGTRWQRLVIIAQPAHHINVNG